MNESDKEPGAEQSLCWNCKHGMCIRETHEEHLLNLGGMMPGMGSPRPGGDDPFGIQGEMPFNQGEEGGIPGQIIEHEHIRAVCYWRPEGLQNVPPILLGVIQQCNRFEKKT